MKVSAIQKSIKETLIHNKISTQIDKNISMRKNHNHNQLREKIKESYPGQSQHWINGNTRSDYTSLIIASLHITSLYT